MTGPWMALTVRALRVDSRTWQSHALRLVFALIAFAGLAYTQISADRFAAPGLQLFSVLTWTNLFLVTLAAVSLFATPITEEKEEATLGLLRMAGIGPLGLLLGKSTTRLLAVLLVLLVQFPFTLLSITLGGVLWDQVLAHYAAITAYLVMIANLGLLCSVVAPRSSNASFLAGVILFSFLFFPGIILGVLRGPQAQGDPLVNAVLKICQMLVACNVWATQEGVLSTGFLGDILTLQVWSNLGAGVVLFFISWLTFDYFTQHHLVSVPSRGGLFAWPQAKTRSVLLRLLAPPRAWPLPFVWKDFFFIAGGWLVLAVRFGVYFLIILGMTTLQVWMFDPFSGQNWVVVFGGNAIWLMLLLGGLEIALLASKVFREETRWQTLSAVMMLPASTGGIIWSKIAGCLISTIPTFFWLGMGFLLQAQAIGQSLWFIGGEGFIVLIYLVVHYIMFLHLTAYLSLLLKWGALPAAFGAVILANFGGCSCCVVPMTAMSMGGGQATFYGLLMFLIIANLVLIVLLEAGIAIQLRISAERG